jgi:1-acyl-sn-glycerol-3-phosphate acyltransferase
VDPFYAGVRVIARFWIWFFFERVEVRHPERVPRAGPVLLCINHPNNLIDSLLVASVLPRKVHYLATAALFRNPLVARVLVALGVIPIYRKADDPDKMDRNTEMFAACDETFDRGQLIAIYPEGVTRAEAHVQRIKTGAAWIALGYEAHAPGRLTVVPVGLNFEARRRFRGRVLVSVGEPVDVSSSLPVYREEPAKALHALSLLPLTPARRFDRVPVSRRHGPVAPPAQVRRAPPHARAGSEAPPRGAAGNRRGTRARQARLPGRRETTERVNDLTEVLYQAA